MVLIREIRSLIYEQGYTIGGARQKLSDHSDNNEAKQQGFEDLRDELEDLLRLLNHNP